MPLKFALEKPALPPEAVPAKAPSAADLEAFRGSVLTVQGLGEEYQAIKARVERGEAYLRANIKLPVVKGWLEQLLPLAYDDSRAAGIAQRIKKMQPGLVAALDLLMDLRSKLAYLDNALRRLEGLLTVAEVAA